METIEAEVLMSKEEIAAESERLCRWGAARAGVIVVLPVVGTGTLMINEFYMISKLAKLRGVALTEKAIAGFVGALGGKFVGQTLATMIPIPILQIPIGISVTYAVGKVACAWLDRGCPEDLDGLKKVYDDAKKEAGDIMDELKNFADKDKPLGDEKKKLEDE